MKGGVDAVGKRGVEREEKKGWRGEERGDDEKKKMNKRMKKGIMTISFFSLTRRSCFSTERFTKTAS